MVRFKAHPWEATSFQEKQQVLSRGVNMVVVLEFSQREEVSPVVLSLVDEDAKVLFQFLLDTFCLAVSLGVICSCGS